MCHVPQIDVNNWARTKSGVAPASGGALFRFTPAAAGEVTVRLVRFSLGAVMRHHQVTCSAVLRQHVATIL